MLQLNRPRRDKVLQIIFILENNLFRIEVDISGVNVQVPFDVKGVRKKLISIFFDGFEVVLLYLGNLRDFLQWDVSHFPFFF
jgi:hypothetical protein